MGSDTESFFTGMAIREDGVGDLVGSTSASEILVVDGNTGLVIETLLACILTERPSNATMET